MGASSVRGDDAANMNLVNPDELAMRSTAATGRCDDDASKRDAMTCSVEYARVGKNMDGRWTNGWQVHNSIDAFSGAHHADTRPSRRDRPLADRGTRTADSEGR